MNLALDANAYCDLCKGNDDVLHLVRTANTVVLTVFTVATLRSAFSRGWQGSGNEKILSRFLNNARVRVIFPDEQTVFHYGRLLRQLKTQGSALPINDLWVASLIVQHDLVLRSTDRHFDSLPQLVRV